MAVRLKLIDRNTPMLLPPDMRDWVAEDDLVHFVIEALETINLEKIRINARGTGSEQYPPSMLLGLLIYCYASGTFSSRKIERMTYIHVGVRYLCGNTHPDHDTICTFRRENRKLIEEVFVKVLELASEMKLMRVGTVAVDGTKIQANASKHRAVSYKRAGEKIEELELEVKKLLKMADEADAKPLEDGLTVPKEIARREERKARLELARKVIEERQRQAEEEKAKDREQKPPGKPPADKNQYNFTDPESRIMKSGSGSHFEQSYNAQAAVDTKSLLIIGQRVTNAATDKQQLVATVSSITPGLGEVQEVLADSGYYGEPAVAKVESRGVTVYAAPKKIRHRRSVEDLLKKEDPVALVESAPAIEKMRHRLSTRMGKKLYGLRKQTVEPVFGQIKQGLGFRQFLMRGLEKVSVEWTLVCTAWNVKRLFNLHRTAQYV